MDDQRRDPFAGLVGEPAQDLGLVPTTLLRQHASGKRKTPVHPSEKRRRRRQVSVTFSIENADVPDRLRALAGQWGMFAPDGRSPNVSGLIEYLLVPQLEAAERGELHPPEGAK